MNTSAPAKPSHAPSALLPKQTMVEATGLNFAYGTGDLQKQILFDVTLQIVSGEIVLLTGPSGSGKTTLLTLIGALRSTQSGSLSVIGTQLSGASPSQLVAVRKNIGYIFQAHNLLGFLTARQNVQMAAELNPSFSPAEAKERSEEMLRLVGLADRIDYLPGNLSGGQKQRVAVARALVGLPKLVLADEPTAALDSHSGREVVELMQRLAREQGSPILMVTHDNRVLDIADRIIHIEDGRVAQPRQ